MKAFYPDRKLKPKSPAVIGCRNDGAGQLQVSIKDGLFSVSRTTRAGKVSVVLTREEAQWLTRFIHPHL